MPGMCEKKCGECGRCIAHQAQDVIDEKNAEIKALSLQFSDLREFILEEKRKTIFIVEKALLDRVLDKMAEHGMERMGFQKTDDKHKEWHCSKCGNRMQFKDGMCMDCYGGDPGD